MKLIKHELSLLLIIVAILSLASCGGEPPELLAVEARLEIRPGEGGERETLSIFVNLRDGDGIEDIEALWIVNEGAELAWGIGPDKWTFRNEGAETWIGAADLAMPDYSPLPRGGWRVIAADLAGRRSERSFRIEKDASSPASPSLKIVGRSVEIISTWPETTLVAYDAAGSLARAVSARAGRADIDTLFGRADTERVFSLAVYGYDPVQKKGAYSWRMKFR